MKNFEASQALRACCGVIYSLRKKMIESPQSFIVSTECNKAAEQNGFRRALGETNGWAAFQSSTAQGTIWLASDQLSGQWFLALDHPGVIAEAGLLPSPITGPGAARFSFATYRALYETLPTVYRLASSLPDAPLKLFDEAIKDLPRNTEAERLAIQRVGQDIFRKSLLEYWNGACPLTGINDTALLRASHIIPWKDCRDDAERLNVHNGLLLSSLWDAAFDAGLVTFSTAGEPEFSTFLSDVARSSLQWTDPLILTHEHQVRLEWHRISVFLR